MKKIYLIFLAFITILLCLTFILTYSILQKQINNQKNLLYQQDNQCVDQLETISQDFENQVNHIAFSDSISKIFISSDDNCESIKRLEICYITFRHLITNIAVFDNDKHAFNLRRDKSNFIKGFYVPHFQKKLHVKEVIEFENEQYQYVLPIFKRNEVVANIVVCVNYLSLFESLLQYYRIDGNAWQWVTSDSGKVIYHNLSDKSFEPKLDISIAKNIEESKEEFLIHGFTYNQKSFKALTWIFPIHLIKKNFGIAFSNDLGKIRQPFIERALVGFILILLFSSAIFFFLYKAITNKELKNKEIVEGENNLIRIFESMPIGVMILTPTKTIRYINKTASDMLYGKDETNIIGRNVAEMITPKHISEKGKADSAYDSGHFYTFGKEGSETTIYKKEIPFNQNEEELIIEAFIDVSPIEKARKLEAAANLAKSDFLAKMSHEIRTPMNGIVGMADALLQQKLTDEQREYAEIVKKSSDLLLTIINDILDFSKVEAGKMMLEEIPFNISEEITLVKELFRPLAEHKGIQIITQIAPNVPHNIIGDPFRLRQVISNLMSNSIKFTHEGKVIIGVELVEEYSGNLTLLFIVEDTGIGIPKGKLETIFASYTQAEGSITRKYGGSGLGTTISKQLVELMGGEIWVESPSTISINPAFPGSKFYFSIEAFCNEKLPKQYDFSKVLEYSQIFALIISPLKNDSEHVYAYFDNFGIGYEKYHIQSHDLLVNKLLIEYDKFHIVIINDSLDYDGFRLAKVLYDAGITNKFLCILVSSNDINGNYIRAKRLGIDYYLIKPYESSEVFDLIQENFTAISPEAHIPAKINKIRKDIHILVAEDNMINQKVAKTIFKNLGYEIELATNGVEAVDFTMKNKYDIIFMDMMMPEKDGIQATKDLRKLGYKGPIIAMTANASKEGKNKAISFGMDGYITKPTKMESIKKVLIKYFSETIL
jgi:signal transduction histidine kinase/CheY-like chemotaxis protein